MEDKYLKKVRVRIWGCINVDVNGQLDWDSDGIDAILREVENHGYDRAMKLANERHAQIMAGSK